MFEFFNLNFNTLFTMYGTNDMNNRDATTNGDATIILDYRTKLEELIQAFKDKGVRNVVGSIPYGTLVNSTKLGAWNTAAALAAKNKSVIFIDLVTCFTDTANPTAYLADGSLHFTTAGHKIIADKIISALNGTLYRQPLLNFPSIAPGTSTSLTTTIPNITTENSVGVPNFTELSALGLMVSARITGPDTVSIDVYNPTTAAIDPPATRGMIKVIVN